MVSLSFQEEETLPSVMDTPEEMTADITECHIALLLCHIALLFIVVDSYCLYMHVILEHYNATVHES